MAKIIIEIPDDEADELVDFIANIDPTDNETVQITVGQFTQAEFFLKSITVAGEVQ